MIGAHSTDKDTRGDDDVAIGGARDTGVGVTLLPGWTTPGESFKGLSTNL